MSWFEVRDPVPVLTTGERPDLVVDELRGEPARPDLPRVATVSTTPGTR